MREGLAVRRNVLVWYRGVHAGAGEAGENARSHFAAKGKRTEREKSEAGPDSLW